MAKMTPRNIATNAKAIPRSSLRWYRFILTCPLPTILCLGDGSKNSTTFVAERYCTAERLRCTAQQTEDIWDVSRNGNLYDRDVCTNEGWTEIGRASCRERVKISWVSGV